MEDGGGGVGVWCWCSLGGRGLDGRSVKKPPHPLKR